MREVRRPMRALAVCALGCAVLGIMPILVPPPPEMLLSLRRNRSWVPLDLQRLYWRVVERRWPGTPAGLTAVALQGSDLRLLRPVKGMALLEGAAAKADLGTRWGCYVYVSYAAALRDAWGPVAAADWAVEAVRAGRFRGAPWEPVVLGMAARDYEVGGRDQQALALWRQIATEWPDTKTGAYAKKRTGAR